jgi:hypothetical protein
LFIKRKVYEKLKETEDKYFELMMKTAVLEDKLIEYKSGKHQCDELCDGCQHLVKGKVSYYDRYSTCGCREWQANETRLCALDRKCKDFKAKEQG